MTSIIPSEILSNDPQHLLYNFPSIHPVKYTKLTQDYHFWRAVDAAEKAAKISGRILVPARCLHWERKNKFAERRLSVGRKSFYILHKDEMTDMELVKYDFELKESQAAAI